LRRPSIPGLPMLWLLIVTQGSGCDLLKVWRDHADEVRGHGIDSGHWWPQAIGKRLNRLTSTCAGRGRCWKFFQ
jgi:hypothetical protein